MCISPYAQKTRGESACIQRWPTDLWPSTFLAPWRMSVEANPRTRSPTGKGREHIRCPGDRDSAWRSPSGHQPRGNQRGRRLEGSQIGRPSPRPGTGQLEYLHKSQIHPRACTSSRHLPSGPRRRSRSVFAGGSNPRRDRSRRTPPPCFRRRRNRRAGIDLRSRSNTPRASQRQRPGQGEKDQPPASLVSPKGVSWLPARAKRSPELSGVAPGEERRSTTPSGHRRHATSQLHCWSGSPRFE